VGTDESNATTDAVSAWLGDSGHELVAELLTDWPEVGHTVGRAVASGEADLGIVFCHTGTGVSIAANKIPGVRAALCGDAQTAAGSRRWNDANVLALSLRTATPTLAVEILEAFLSTGVEPEEQPLIESLEPSGPAHG
jgi:ribose 5-phosphate isomerase B